MGQIEVDGQTVDLGTDIVPVQIHGSISPFLDFTEDPNVGRFIVLDTSEFFVGTAPKEPFLVNGIPVVKVGMEVLFDDITYEFQAIDRNIFGELVLKQELLIADMIPLTLYEHAVLQGVGGPLPGGRSGIPVRQSWSDLRIRRTLRDVHDEARPQRRRDGLRLRLPVRRPFCSVKGAPWLEGSNVIEPSPDPEKTCSHRDGSLSWPRTIRRFS